MDTIALSAPRVIGFLAEEEEADLPQLIAENIAVAWAREGLRVLVLHHVNITNQPAPRPHAPGRQALPTATPVITELRPVSGPGTADRATVREDDIRKLHRRPALHRALEELRSAYDHILLVQYTLHPADLADVYVALPATEEIPTGESRWDIEHGRRTLRTHPYTPATAATVWRRRLLRPIYDSDEIRRTECRPLAGLILTASPSDEPQAVPDDFAQAVEEHLAAQGSPVLARLPRVPAGVAGDPSPIPVADAPGSPVGQAMAAAACALRAALPPVLDTISRDGASVPA